MLRLLPLPAALALSGAFVLANPVTAQAPSAVPAFGPSRTPDADALALAMRRLADAPRDLDALLTAAELSLKVGDASGAAALFKRAEGVEPMNGRVRAGMARILVTQERPGEALRYFDQAIGFGLDPRSFAGDRGLAYDLIGESERAQRDYRLALKDGESDEVRRRYALSLAISGKQLVALQQIDPLTRRGDRAAWRTRAFILAMTGDLPGATAIVTRSMPESLAQGLAPFLERLGALPAADKAFAVHFGELHATPARVADARLTPALPVLGPDPDVRVQVAVALPTLDTGKRGRRQRDRRARERRAEVASVPATRGGPAAAPSRPPAASTPAAQSPVQVAANVARPPAPIAARAAPVRSAPVPPAYTPMRIDPFQKATLADYALVRRYNREMEARLARNAARRAASPTVAASAPPPMPTAAPPRAAAPLVVQVAAPAPAVSLALGGIPPADAAPAPSVPTRSAPAAQLAAESSAVPTAPDASERTIVARLSSGEPPPSQPATSRPGTRAPAVPAPVRVAREPARVAVPRADARPVRSPAPAPALAAEQPATRRRTAAGRPREEAVADAPARSRAGGARTRATELAEAAPTRTRGARRDAAGEETAPVRRGARTRDEAEVAATDTRRGARRAAAKDADAPAKGKPARGEKPDKAEPARIWVQVAGGANQGDLPKAWSAVQGRSAALKGRQAYSTALRATNRVVTGPFKTDAEARAFVNQLAKQGVSAFPFTSDKGQKMAKLPPK